MIAPPAAEGVESGRRGIVVPVADLCRGEVAEIRRASASKSFILLGNRLAL
jgi:hypothetical protein